MISYSLWLKRIPFLEALIVAAGLPLRALAGASLANVPASDFLMGCAYCLALFLVVGKRQWEFLNAGRFSSSEHRPALASYGAEGLDSSCRNCLRRWLPMGLTSYLPSVQRPLFCDVNSFCSAWQLFSSRLREEARAADAHLCRCPWIS